MSTTDPELRQILSEAGRYGARLRDLDTTPDQRRDNTAAARAARAANHLEKVKAEVDPDGLLPADERERQARLLVEARAAKLRLDRLRRARKLRLIEGDVNELELADAHAS